LAKLTQLSSEEKLEILTIQRDAAFLSAELQAIVGQHKDKSASHSELSAKYAQRKKELEDKYNGTLDNQTLTITPKPFAEKSV
jgi:hypothetical protein